MCGLNLINGVDHLAGVAMNAAIRHRGTFSRVETIHKRWTLGHVRLPIVGLDDRFNQPFRQNGWTFAFAGEIVNFKELAPYTECDVEVLADLWFDEGARCLPRFDGFWSIVAIHESQPDLAHILLDPLAKKPLYIRNDAHGMAISSEIKALDELGPLEPDPAYFSSVRKWGYHPGTRTWARGVRKLPAGCHLVLRAGERGVEILEPDEITPNPSIDLKAAIETSVRRRFASADIPLALLLSGGLDSSIILKVLQRHGMAPHLYHAENGERPDAELIADGTPITFIEEFDHAPLEEILRANEGPVDLGSMLQQHALGQAIGERVCLSGDGADELFGGYKRAAVYDSQGSDVFEELVYYHLPRLDKMMMAGTVELRSPFLGRDVIAGALALPWEQRKNKLWLRKAFEDVLPERIAWGLKRPLKSPPVLKEQIGWRERLISTFLEMVS